VVDCEHFPADLRDCAMMIRCAREIDLPIFFRISLTVQQMLSKLLDPKGQVSTNGTRGEKGSGLGLQICQEIIQANDGWMKIESSSGKGTTIIIGIKASEK